MKTTLQDIIKKNPIMAALCREEDRMIFAFHG